MILGNEVGLHLSEASNLCFTLLTSVTCWYCWFITNMVTSLHLQRERGYFLLLRS
jgi:hypothetical protein